MVGAERAVAFRNPANGYEERVGLAWLWCLLFGCFYFGFKGLWGHVLLSLLLAICTAGISWFIYPFFANGIVRKHYLRRGWAAVSAEGATVAGPAPKNGGAAQAVLGFVAMAIVAGVALRLARGDATESTAHQLVREAGVLAEAKAGTKATKVAVSDRIPVPSDPKATYESLGTKRLSATMVEVTTRRKGRSGESYAMRLIDCASQRFGYIAEGDTLGELEANKRAEHEMGDLVEGSISWHVSQFACAR